MRSATPGITSSLVSSVDPAGDQVGHRAAFARALQNFVDDIGDGFGMIELQALRLVLARKLGRDIDRQPFHFRRRQ